MTQSVLTSGWLAKRKLKHWRTPQGQAADTIALSNGAGTVLDSRLQLIDLDLPSADWSSPKPFSWDFLQDSTKVDDGSLFQQRTWRQGKWKFNFPCSTLLSKKAKIGSIRGGGCMKTRTHGLNLIRYLQNINLI